MAFRWICNTCGDLHGTNPSRCRNCGASVFSPLSHRELQEYAAKPASVESLDPDDILTYGTAPDPDYPSSPDVATDGSMAGAPTPTVGDSSTASLPFLSWRVILGLSVLLLYGMVAFLVF